MFNTFNTNIFKFIVSWFLQNYDTVKFIQNSQYLHLSCNNLIYSWQQYFDKISSLRKTNFFSRVNRLSQRKKYKLSTDFHVIKMKRRKLQSILLWISNYPVKSALNEDWHRLRGWRSWQMRPLKSGAIFVGQPVNVDPRSIWSRPRGWSTNFLGFRIFLPAILQDTLLLESDAISAFPFRVKSTIRTDILVLSDDGDWLVRG